MDVAGTLIQLRESPARTYRDTAERHGVRRSLAEVEAPLSAALASLAPPTGADLADVSRRECEMWRGIVGAALGEQAARGACFDELYAHYATRAAWEPVPGARETLLELARSGLRLAIVSNMDSRLPALLEELALAELFPVIAIPSSCGFAKPDPRIFAWALARLAVEPGHAVYVGDRLRNCVDAARAAGLKAYRLDPAGTADSEDALPGWPALAARLAP